MKKRKDNAQLGHGDEDIRDGACDTVREIQEEVAVLRRGRKAEPGNGGAGSP